MDGSGRIVTNTAHRGLALQPGQRSLQGIGSAVTAVAALPVGEKLAVTTHLINSRTGDRVTINADTYIANGGPILVNNGQKDVTPLEDGLVRATEPSEYYGFAAKRNPRTFAGTKADGTLVLITADGRSTASLGLSITEEADVARSLGLTNAMNLDGGGSTTMVVNGAVINAPSDATGQRPVGDALLIEPTQK